MAFGVLAAGHSHPLLAEALQYRVANGTCYTFPVEDGIALAEEIRAPIRRRPRPVQQLRHRGHHGRHSRRARLHRPREDHQVRGRLPRPPRRRARQHPAAARAMGPIDRRRPCRPAPGSRAAGSPRRSIAPFNEPELLAAILEAHARRDRGHHHRAGAVQHRRRAAQCRASWSALRELATEHGAVLIFDEVKTGVVLAWGGAYEHFGVKADLVLPGQEHRRRDAHRRLRRQARGDGARSRRSRARRPPRGARRGRDRPIDDPGGATRVAHLGTFNGNPLSMTAGLVTLTQILTKDVYPRLHAMADRLTAGSQAVLDEYEMPGYAINVGPKGCVMFTPERVTNYRDFIGLDRRAVGGQLLLPRQPRHPAAARPGRPVDALGPAQRRRRRSLRGGLPRVRRRADRLTRPRAECRGRYRPATTGVW